MKKTTIVAMLLLICNPLSAKNISSEISDIESQWATIYYTLNGADQAEQYPALLAKINTLSKQHANSVELTIWQAIIIATNAAYQTPFTALDSLNNAKKLLENAIKQNPRALQGAAQVTLATLYYMTPGWPISYGNHTEANKLFKQALEINPDSIDANYFYADYLLNNDRINEASKHFKLALKVPSRKEQMFADNQLKKEAETALMDAEKRKLNSGKNRFLSLFNSAKSKQLPSTEQ